MHRKISRLFRVQGGLSLSVLGICSSYALCASAPLGQPRQNPPQESLNASARQEWERVRNVFIEAKDTNNARLMESSGRRLLELALKTRDVNLVARSYNNLGIALQAQGNVAVSKKQSGEDFYGESLRFFEKALELAEQVTADHLRPALLIRSNGGMGDTYFALGDKDRAETYWLKGLEAAKDAHDAASIPTKLNSLGSLYSEQKRLNTKAEFFESQRVFFKKEKMAECAAWCDYFLALGIPSDRQIPALKAMIASADEFDPEKQSEFRATALHLLELAYSNEGLFEEVLHVCEQVDQIWEKRLQTNPDTDIEALAECRNNKARAYLILGDGEASLKEFARALDLEQRAPSKTPLWVAIERNRTLTKIVIAEDDDADLTLPEELAKQSFISQQPSHSVAVADVILLAGIALRRGEKKRSMGHQEEAQKIFQEALDLLEKDAALTNTSSGQGALGLKRLFQGALQLERGQAQHAAETLLLARQNLAPVQNRNAIGFCLPLLAVAYDRAEQPQKAEEIFRQAILQFEERQARVTSPQRMGPFQFVQAASLYADYADFLARNNRQEEALLMADRARARGLAQQALKRIAKSAAENKRQEQEKLWTEPLNPEELRRLVHKYPDTLFLHYNMGRSEAMLLAFGDKMPVQRLPLGIRPLALAHQIERWIQNLIRGGSISAEVRLAKELGETLLKPLYTENVLFAQNGTMRWRRLVIIPDGAMHNVPYAALMLPEKSALRLIDRLPSTVTLSLKQLARKSPPVQSKRGMLVISDPTKGSRQAGAVKGVVARQNSLSDLPLPPSLCLTADLIARGYRGNTKHLIGKQATKSAVLPLLPDYSLLVFVTHGQGSKEQSGLASRLTLAPENGEKQNGRLEAGEILARPLAARMALLMACETAQGQLAGGEGSQGLVWAFWAAGCPSVIASLWEVEPVASGKLLLAFWAELQKGRPKDEALRTAILAIRNSNSKYHPVDWAAFQVYGNPEPLQEFTSPPRKNKLDAYQPCDYGRLRFRYQHRCEYYLIDKSDKNGIFLRQGVENPRLQ